MRKKKFLEEKELVALAKQFREASGKSKVSVAREFGVAPPNIFNAEERPEMSLTRLRIRIIESCSPFKVVGPVYYLEKK